MKRLKPPVFSQLYTQRDKQEREGEKRERGCEIDNDGKEWEGGSETRYMMNKKTRIDNEYD